MNIRLIQLDGVLPNLAIMRLAKHHRDLGDYVHFSRTVHPGTDEPEYDRVLGY